MGERATAFSNTEISEMHDRIFGLVGPTYIVDLQGRFVDWNPAFEELIATPLKLVRQQPAEDFAPPHIRIGGSSHPEDQPSRQVDTHLVSIWLPEFGSVTFRRVIAQIPNNLGAFDGWSVHLAAVAGTENTELWTRLAERLEQEITWSKYAAVYDALLLHFPDYLQLLETVAHQVDGAQMCVDLGTGTGNSAFSLLAHDVTRSVWAIDCNEMMLGLLRSKTRQEHRDRLHVFKCDIQSMPFIAHETFDAATMVNTLYALDDPLKCLGEVQRIMKRGGVLVISTSHRNTDVNRLFARIEEVLTAVGLRHELAEAVKTARERHGAMDAQIHRFTIAEIEEMVKSQGFDIESMRPDYVDAVVVVRAIKR